MAGHSKWANIKHRKGAQDAKRGKIFTRLIREITIAAKLGGADSAANPRLRAAIDNALSNNMTKDTIERAVKRGAGGGEGGDVEEVRYEGYGPGGVAVLVDCLTDNKNRTVAEVRHAFTKAGGNLATSGSVSYLFKLFGVISYPIGTDEDVIMELALESGADDIVSNEDGSIDVMTAPEVFTQVKTALLAAGREPEHTELSMYPSTSIPLNLQDAEKMIRLIDVLEDLDDTQNVYSNARLGSVLN